MELFLRENRERINRTQQGTDEIAKKHKEILDKNDCIMYTIE